VLFFVKKYPYKRHNKSINFGNNRYQSYMKLSCCFSSLDPNTPNVSTYTHSPPMAESKRGIGGVE